MLDECFLSKGMLSLARYPVSISVFQILILFTLKTFRMHGARFKAKITLK